MDWIVIEGVRPWDGRYEFDLAGSEPTTREWGWIKRLSGYLPATIGDGLKGADPELFCVFAAVALRRAGKIEPQQVPEIFERLADAPFGSTIRLEPDTAQEEDPGPPPGKNSGNGTSSGPGSTTNSDSTDSTGTRVPVGIPDSDTSESLPIRWGN